MVSGSALQLLKEAPSAPLSISALQIECAGFTFANVTQHFHNVPIFLGHIVSPRGPVDISPYPFTLAAW